MNKPPVVFPVERLDLSFAPKPWAFADENRVKIDATFAELKRKKPALWNGRILLLYEQQVSGGVFRGKFLEADYASFSSWNSWGRPPAGVHDCFGAAAIISRDGAVLLGVMAEHTFNAGKVYFPSGTPDLDDIVGGKVDFDRSMRRELKEETGLDPDEFTAAAGWTTVVAGKTIVLVKALRSQETAETLGARIRAHMTRERQPELADIRIVRSAADFDPAMFPFVTAYLTHFFAAG